GDQRRPLLRENFWTGSRGARNAAAQTGAGGTIPQAGGEIVVLALRHPDGNDGLARVDFAHGGQEAGGDVRSLQSFRRRGDAVIQRPSALQIPAAARGGPALQIIQQKSPKGLGGSLLQRLDACEMRVERLTVPNRDPGICLGDLLIL